MLDVIDCSNLPAVAVLLHFLKPLLVNTYKVHLLYAYFFSVVFFTVTGLSASVELSLIDTLTFLTNQPLVFEVEQGSFHTELMPPIEVSNLLGFQKILILHHNTSHLAQMVEWKIVTRQTLVQSLTHPS